MNLSAFNKYLRVENGNLERAVGNSCTSSEIHEKIRDRVQVLIYSKLRHF